MKGLHATTTLQALVNLKRPTLLLQQLEPEGENDITAATRPVSMSSAPLHSLKFNYDATTPEVHISLSVYPSPVPGVEGKESIVEEEVKTIYSGVHPGGFNQVFQLPTSSAMDLSSAVTPMPNESTLSFEESKLRDVSIDSNADSVNQSMGNMQLNHLSQVPDLSTVPEGAAPEEERPRRRFGIFPRRQRPEDLENAPIEMSTRTEAEQEEEVKEPEKGMRLLIRIEALGPTGDALKRQNAQLTHILISGMWIPDAGSNVSQGGAGGKRVWVVKVVRREAVVSRPSVSKSKTDIRLARIPSCLRRSTVYRPHQPVKARHPPHTHPLEEMPIHTAQPLTSVSSVSPLHETSSSSHADTWSYVGTVQLEWSNSEQEEKSLEEKKPPLPKRPMQMSSLDLLLLLARPFPLQHHPEELQQEEGRGGRERQKDGIVPFVDNLILPYFDSPYLHQAKIMKKSVRSWLGLHREHQSERHIHVMLLPSPLPSQGVLKRCSIDSGQKVLKTTTRSMIMITIMR